MQVKAEQLAAHLQSRARAGGLARVYTVSGDEALLAIEAQDAVRIAARRAGYTEREVLHADARFDWSQLAAVSAGQSLFAQRRIIEVRLPGGKPGKAGAAALQAHAAAAGDDTLTLLALPRLDRDARESAWAKALDAAGVWVDAARVERAALPGWIGQRLARQGQHAAPEALEFIADRVEGNLLAAHQEVQKLALLHPEGELSLEQVADAVLNVARYDVFGLPQAMLAGDPARVLKILEGLRAEGEAPPLIAWTIAEELRLLARATQDTAAGKPFANIARDLRVFGNRQALLQRAAQRIPPARAAGWLARCSDIDRLVKGLRDPGADSDPWLELADLAAEVSAAIRRSGAEAPSRR